MKITHVISPSIAWNKYVQTEQNINAEMVSQFRPFCALLRQTMGD